MTAIVLLLVALARPAEGVVSETRPAMGSVATVTLAGTTPERAAPAIEAAFAVFERVEWSMNEWRAGSPLARLNDAAGRGWVPLPGDLCEVLSHRQGRGAPHRRTLRSDLGRPVRPVALRRERAGAAGRTRRCARAARSSITVRSSCVPGGTPARHASPGPACASGLGGLAKGWALDAAARALRALGHADFLLQAGGDLYAAGTRGGAPWRVGVRDPRGGPLDELAQVDVRDRAFSTSGDYEHAYVVRRAPLSPPHRPAHLPPRDRVARR